jgi:hypothetical protein
MELFLIDAIGPFFKGYDRKRINWSKIPFRELATEGEARTEQFAQIRRDLETFARRVAAVGYNAVSLDDLAHLADHPCYEPLLRERIAVFREEFRLLFEILKQQGLDIYITFDVMTYTPASKAYLGRSLDANVEFLRDLIDSFLHDFPEIDGLIFRIGESDGVDVRDDFRSELFCRTPATVNRVLRSVLPVFEKHGKRLILRTWTVGAYRLGDLMWNRGTFDRVLRGIHSEHFAVALKHGDSDFFRYLAINRNFFRSDVAKIVELQSKREYEGCGEFPSFVGWDHAHYADELKQASNLIGISVWCQTGGWTRFRRLAYIGEGSLWTEINTYVTLRIFRDQQSVEDALAECIDEPRYARFLQFLRLSDEVIKELLYTPQFAEQQLFFRRVRIPPLIGIYWSTIFVNHSLRKVMRYFVKDPETCVRQGYAALGKIKQMKKLAAELDLPVDDIRYMQHSFKILALARQYFFYPYDQSIRKRLTAARKQYKKAYPNGTRPRYRICLDFKPFRVQRRFVNWFLSVALRRGRGYRLVDQIFVIHLLSLIYRIVRTTRSDLIPRFARKSAMGIDAIFR